VTWGPTTARCDEVGGIVLGWLARLVAVLAVLAVVSFDGVSLLVARVSAADSARSAARAASGSYAQTPNPQLAYLAASQTAGAADTVAAERFQLGRDGSVTLVVRRTATTLLAHRMPGVRGWTRVEVTAQAAPPT
jgi:hypothetical protein